MLNPILKIKTLRFLILIILVANFPNSYAQDDGVTEDCIEELTGMRIEEMSIYVDSILQVIEKLQAENNKLLQSEDELKKLVKDKEQTINSQGREIENLKRKLIFADSVVARVSNDCLRQKYDRQRVAEALTNFSKMYSPELQRTFSPLKSLLTNYGSYTQELKEIFATAENDNNFRNPFKDSKTAQEYIQKIKDSRYYKDAYDKNWTIPYLNKVVDDAIARLKVYKYDINGGKGISLLDLMQ